MRRYILLAILLCTTLLTSLAANDSTQVRDTNDSILVSLITCSPGTEVYAVYGHTALRIEIPSQGIDMAVNYGLFAFDAPNFIWRFIKGETDYIVGLIGYPIFEQEYTTRGSQVTLQKLNLSEKEKIELVRLLNENLRPENREYRYNFLYNNCSTKARDKVEEALTGHITIDEQHQHTYRSIIHQYTEDYPWLQFGIDYLLGIEADRAIDARQQMFAPEYLMNYMTRAQLTDNDKQFPYVIETTIVEPTEEKDDVWRFPLNPTQAMILLLLLVMVVSTFEIFAEHRQGWFDILLLTIQGIMGCIVTFLLFFSEHPTVGSNIHAIYLNPLPLIFIPFIISSLLRHKVSALYHIEALMLIVFTATAIILKQSIQPAAWILVIALLIRALHNIWIYPRAIKKMSIRSPKAAARILILLLTILPTQRAQASAPPKVVIGIVVDQLRADYLEKYEHLYGENGFKKLFTQGRLYTNGYFSHDKPDRSSAVAEIYTGTSPYYNGIIGNYFLDRKNMKVMSTVDDTKYKGINTEDQSSPSRFMVTTLTDELKLATKGHAYVMSIAPERDAAVLAGGHVPNAVMWLSDDNALWSTSTYYNGLPAWTRQYNHRTRTRFDWNDIKWEPYYPTGVYSYSVYDGIPKAFHHTFRNGDTETVKRYKTSACINDEVTQLAKTCIAGNVFGRNKTTDMLCIGYYAGNYRHAPQWEAPIEQQDIYCRLDRNIADLLQTIEDKIGLENAVIFITSTGYYDSSLPDSRLFTLPTGELKMERCVALLNMYLGGLYGKDNYIEGSYLNEIYINHSLIEKKQLRMKELQERCIEFLCQMEGIKRVHSSIDILSGTADDLVRNSYNADRSGDLILEIAPGWTLIDKRWGERIYASQTHIPVPIILYGAGLTPGINRTPTPVESIAPTIAHILRISAPNGCSTRPVE